MAITLFSAVLAACLAIAVRELFDWRDRSNVRRQIIFLLTALAIRMGTNRDYPVNALEGFDDYLDRLKDRVFSTDGARALGRKQRDLTYAAILKTEQSIAFLKHQREAFLKDQTEFREYMIGSASAAFESLMSALDSLGGVENVIYPPDPRGLHNWRPGLPIKRREIV